MYYVYSLSFDGIVFYIGCSKHPFKRFKEHATGNDLATFKVIYNKAKAGVMPVINILHHCDNKNEAFKRERFLIRFHCSINHKLSNTDYNRMDNLLDEHSDRFIAGERKKRIKFDYSSVKIYIDAYINNIV